MKKFLYIALAAVCFACTPKPIDEASLFLSEDQATELIQQGTLLTINEFLDTYMTEKGNYLSETSPYRQRSLCVLSGDTFYLFSIDTISKAEKPVYIRGRITTDDYAGNFYKSLCIQQVVDGKQQALRISVDAGSVGGLYQIGQEVLIRVDGLAVGRYANQPQLCVPSYNNNTYANSAKEKVGWASGRIPMAIFKERVSCIGKPDVSKLVYDEMLITDFTSILGLKEARQLDARLVRLKNVHFSGEYFNYGKPATCEFTDPNDFTNGKNANVFAPTTGNIGYPQGRVIKDEAGNYTAVSTSEYAKFALFYLPGATPNSVDGCADYKGDIVGILGFYVDNGLRATSDPSRYGPAIDDWAITIRSLDDLDLRDTGGNLWPRIEYSK